MKWFGRKAAPVAARPPLARAWFAMNWSGAGAWPQGYDAQVKAAMLVNPVAQRALRLVSEAAGSTALIATATAPDDAQAALDLISCGEGGQGLIETLAAHVLLHGNGYVQIGLGPDGRLASLYTLRPDRVTIEQDGQGWPVG